MPVPRSDDPRQRGVAGLAVTVTSRVPVSLMSPSPRPSGNAFTCDGRLVHCVGSALPPCQVERNAPRLLMRTMALRGTSIAAVTPAQLPSTWRTSAVSGVRSKALMAFQRGPLHALQ